MIEFEVGFHAEDGQELMHVRKLNEEEFILASALGSRKLFELDTNVGYFVFFDAADEKGTLSYMVLRYEDDSEEPEGCYSFELKDFYEFLALYTKGMNEMDGGEDEQEYGPLEHLAHLLHHVAEAGNTAEK